LHACRFTLQLIVTTSHGSFSENINYQGKPFELSAMAPATESNSPLSGYKTAYVDNGAGWTPIDPATYKDK
ncbi:MAG: hypothetical protein ACRDRL_20925, partial [Sciscionella sp.]